MTRPAAAAFALWAGLTATAPCQASQLPSVLPARGFDPRKTDDGFELPRQAAARLRQDALARAAVFRPPESAALARLDRQPDDFFGQRDELVCKFLPGRTGGTVPKFECVFEGGSVLKVKYGGNPEIHTEVAATRLLQALGAGADHMYFVRRLRCFGCPADPFALLSCVSSPFPERRGQCAPVFGIRRGTDGSLKIDVDYAGYVDFTNVSVERRLEGHTIKAGDQDGWGWAELDQVEGTRDARRARRTERDALRLVAVLLNDWDTHTDNQRLVCLDDTLAGAAGCRHPFAYIQDVGATFGAAGGPAQARKLDLEAWSAAPVWKDEARCLVAIQSPRLHGATFGEATISEAGRQFLARRLERLDRGQVRQIFDGARFAAYQGASPASRDVSRWVSAFEDKVRKISARSPCPTP
jgi:hypothetical protein